MAKIVGKSKTGYLVDLSLEELNGVLNASQDHYEITDAVLDINERILAAKKVEDLIPSMADAVQKAQEIVDAWNESPVSTSIGKGVKIDG